MKNTNKYINVIGDDGINIIQGQPSVAIASTEEANSTDATMKEIVKNRKFIIDNINSGKFYNYQSGKSIDIQKPEIEKSISLAVNYMRHRTTTAQLNKALEENPSLDIGKWYQIQVFPRISNYVTARRKAEAKKQAEMDALKNKLADAQKQLLEAQQKGKPTAELETKVAETNMELTKVENTPVDEKPNKMKYVYIGGAVIGVLILGYFGWKHFIKKK